MAINPVNTNRVTGLASGFDTDSLVTSMLSNYQARLDRQNRTTAKLQWKADALRNVNSLLKTFRESNMSVLNSSANMLSKSSYSAFNVTMLSTTKAVSVSAGASAVEGKVTIKSVTQLAAAATLGSADVFSEPISTNTALKDLSFNNALRFDENGEISFSINDVDFTFTEDTKLSDMMSQINASSAGVKMSYSSLKDGFTLTSKTVGSASEIKIVNTSGNAFSEEDNAFGIAAQTMNGKDAMLNIDGYDVVRSGNTFTIDGITYTLNDVYTPAEEEDGISFTVSRNVEEVVDKISKFVDSYNELIGKLQGMLSESVFRSYTPLTDEQRDAMSDTDIAQWEEKAKSGLLRNDASIRSLIDTIRSALYTAVEGTGLKLSDIGLTTGAYSDGAKITLDKAKLRTALENNPDAVANLFTQTSSSEDAGVKFKESGLIVRISNAMLNYTSQATSTTLSLLQTQISDSEEAADTLEDKMYSKSEALYRKFSAMESALAKLNSQSSWLSSLFSSNKSS